MHIDYVIVEGCKIILLYHDTLKKISFSYFILYKCWSHRMKKRSYSTANSCLNDFRTLPVISRHKILTIVISIVNKTIFGWIYKYGTFYNI